mgnify:FL=1
MPAVAVISLGNTSVAAGLWRGDRLVFVRRLPAGELGRRRLFAGAARRDLAGAELAAVASVVPAQERSLEKAVRNELGSRCAARYLGRELHTGLALKVKRPRQVGADRLAGALAAHRRFGAAMVVDFGTAVTVNSVTAKGEFLGGAIAPGAALIGRALAGRKSVG